MAGDTVNGRVSRIVPRHLRYIGMALRGGARCLGGMGIVTLGTPKIRVRALAQIAAMAQDVSIGMTFFAQRRHIGDRFVLLARLVIPRERRTGGPILHHVTHFASDIFPIRLRDQRVTLGDADGGIRFEFARHTVRWRIRLGGGVPIQR